MNCDACHRGHTPSAHQCIICSKKVHLFEKCSLSIIGQDEGYAEKRICIDCSQNHPSLVKKKLNDSLVENKLDGSSSLIDNLDKSIVNEKEKSKPKLKDFFEYDSIKGVKYGHCKVCGKNKNNLYIKSIKMLDSNTSGLKSHIKRVHKNLFEKIFPLTAEISSEPKYTLTSYGIRSVSKFNCKVNHNRRTVCWIAKKNLPLNFFHDQETRNYFASFNKDIPLPNKNQLSSMVATEFKEMQKNLVEILKSNKSKFAFTVDAWSSKAHKSYYGITLHFINDNWELISSALDFKASNGKHKGIDIAEIFYKVTNFYGITDKISGITVDNATANSTFMKEFQKIISDTDFDAEDQHFRCLAHILNLGVQDILKLMKVNIDKPNIDEYVNDDETYDLEEKLAQDDEQNEDEIAFLAKKNDDETSDSEEKLSLEKQNECDVASLVNKIRLLNVKIRNSEKLSQKLKSSCQLYEEKFRKPEIDTKTRWNSTYTMLEVDLDMKKSLNALCDSNKKEISSLKLNEDEWTFIDMMVKFLQDFKAVSEQISGEQYVTLPDSVLRLNVLLDKIEKDSHLLDTKDSRTDLDEQLISAFQAGRDKLLKHYEKFNWIYCISLVLDPRIKSEGLCSTKWGLEMKDFTLKKFKLTYNKYYQNINSQKTKSPEKKRRKINTSCSLDFNVCYVQNNEDDYNSEEIEINNYLSSSRVAPRDCPDLLNWWKNHQNIYPILATMARDILCVPATSVPVERMFSEAAQIVTKFRCSLNDDKIRELILINLWMKSFLKDSICEVDL